MTRTARFARKALSWVAVMALLGVAYLVAGPRELGGPAGYVVVSGDSMEPTYSDGDLVITRDRDRYRVGDIITYQPRIEEDFPVIHRVVEVDGDELVTRGDNRAEDDAWAIDDEDVVGATWLHVPRGGIALSFLLQPATLFALFVFAAVFTLLGRKEARSAADEDDECGEGEPDDPDPHQDQHPSAPMETSTAAEAGFEDDPHDDDLWVDPSPSPATTAPRRRVRRTAKGALVIAAAVIATAAVAQRAHAATLTVRAPVLQVFELDRADLPALDDGPGPAEAVHGPPDGRGLEIPPAPTVVTEDSSVASPTPTASPVEPLPEPRRAAPDAPPSVSTPEFAPAPTPVPDEGAGD